MDSLSDSEANASHVSIPCPHCGLPSTRIKSLRTGVLVFLGVAGFWRTWTETGCTTCVRGKLIGYTGLNLLTAHILWPIAVLPWMVVQLMRTALDGHSPEILKQLGLPVPPPRPLWEQFQTQLPIAFRVLGIVQFLLGSFLLAGIAFVLGVEWFHLRKLDLIIYQGLVAAVGIAAGYLVYSGASKLFAQAPSVWHRMGVAVLFGGLLPLASPWIAQLTWIPKEQELFAATIGGDARATDYYVREVPAVMWRPEPVGQYVDARIAHRKVKPTVWTDDDLSSVRYALEEHHAGNPDFSTIHQNILTALRPPATKVPLNLENKTRLDESH